MQASATGGGGDDDDAGNPYESKSSVSDIELDIQNLLLCDEYEDERIVDVLTRPPNPTYIPDNGPLSVSNIKHLKGFTIYTSHAQTSEK